MTVTDPQALKTPKRVRLPSVTTLLGDVIPKGGLPFWYAQRTAEGATILARAGEPIDRMSGPDLLRALSEHGLGAEAARDNAAERGIDLHAGIEDYMRSGAWPDPIGRVQPEHYGYWRAAEDWLRSVNIEPVSVEELIADPAAGYAGRVDLRARVNDRLLTVDFTTSDKLAIYSSKVAQALLYERAARVCGDEAGEGILVVSFSKDGKFRCYERAYRPETTQRLLDWLAEFKPIDSECESANRAEREARKDDPAPKVPKPKVEYVADDPSTHPGAMARALRRELPDGGLIEYVESPAGWTTQAGTRRRSDFRAYYWTPPAQAELPVAA